MALHKRGRVAVAEHERLAWIGDRLPVPDVVAFHVDAGEPLLELAVPEGVPIADAAGEDRPALIGSVLAEIHRLPVDECPFDAGLAATVPEAWQRVLFDEVDESTFPERFAGWTARDVFQQVLLHLPADEDGVFTHGRFSVDKVIVGADGVSACVDWHAAGVADRYRDLGTAVRGVVDCFGVDAVRPMLDAYGLIGEPDQAKLDFFVLLDLFSRGKP